MQSRILTQNSHARLVVTQSQYKEAALGAIASHGGGGIGYVTVNNVEWTIFYLSVNTPPDIASLISALQDSGVEVDSTEMTSVHGQT